MEIAEIPECVVLKAAGEIKRLPCEDNCLATYFPSHFDRVGKPRGCWIAHTALCILEAHSIKEQVIPCLARKGIPWKAFLSAVALHDAGKLTEEYLVNAYPYHNALSAIIALKLLQAHPNLSKYAYPISCAIFLHHEYRHWKLLLTQEEYLIPLDLTRTVRRLTRIRMMKGFEKAIEALIQVLECLPEREPIPLLNSLAANNEYRTKYKEYRLMLTSNFLGWKALSQALTLHWLLYLVDNRAASARDTTSNYWRIALAEFSSINNDPYRLAEKILQEGGRRLARVALTLISLKNQFPLTDEQIMEQAEHP